MIQTTKTLSKRSDPDHIYVHKDVKKQLNNAKIKVLKKDWDRVYLIDGNEGSGKSVLALQLAKYLDPTFNIDRVTFNGEDFSKAIDESTKGQAIVFDEAFNGLASSSATSKMNRFLVRKLMECRQKNLFVFIVLPTFFLLQKYAAVFRSSALFHVFVDKNGNRGRYKVYNHKTKKLLYIKGNKLYSYAFPKVFKTYDFSGKYPIDEEAYRSKKHSSLLDNDEKKEGSDKNYLRLGIAIKMLKEIANIPYTKMEEYFHTHNLPIDDGTLSRIAQKVQ